MALREAFGREEQGLRLLPEGSGQEIKRWSIKLGGFALAIAGLAGLATLLSHDPGDPSAAVASSGVAENLLGAPGALFSHALLEWTGMASFLLVFLAVPWGWRLWRAQRLNAWMVRLPLALVMMLLAMTALSLVAAPESWPLLTGMGGVTGDLLAQQVLGFGLSYGWLSWSALVGAFLIYLYLLGLTRSEWQGLGRGLGLAAGSVGRSVNALGKQAEEQQDLDGKQEEKPGRLAGLKGLFAFKRKSLSEDGEAETKEPPAKPLRRPAAVEEDADSGGPLRKWFPRRGDKGVERKEPSLGLPPDAGEEAAPAINAPGMEVPGMKAPGIKLGGAADAIPEPLEEEIEPDLVAPRKRPTTSGRRKNAEAQQTLKLNEDYELPPLALLQDAPKVQQERDSTDALEKNARLLEGVLNDFGVRGEIVKVRPGPVVTRYELEPAPGTKTSRVVGLADDIARSMSAISVRVAVVPGSNVIGIELPNQSRETVFLGELLASSVFEAAKGALPIVLGKDIGGAPQIVDLARMPHLLVAGTTGSGKSVGVNAMILSLLYRLPPERCKLIMIDPKMLELSIYDGIPHLLSPVVTEPKKAVVALKWAVREMEQRYRNMSKLGVRNIDGYNERIEKARKSGEVLTRKVQTGFDPDTGQPVFEEQPFDLEPLPYIVVIADEMADLMLVAGKDVEAAIQRLAQMARAAGIHLIMATQRPSVDVITGTIKANFPTRISYNVTSKIDSRTILGESGAEHLLGNGDMLYMGQGGRIHRVHGPFVSDQEVEDIVAHLKTQGLPAYQEDVTSDPESEGEALGGGSSTAEGGSGDDLFDQAVALVAQHQKASTSFVQRHLQIGYNRAARIIEQMEEEGMVSEANHVGKREVLLPKGGGEDY